MAGIARLTEGRTTRLALLGVAVVLAHLLVIELMWRTITNPSELRPMASPMFTRLLKPEEPPAVAAVPARPQAPREAAPRRPEITTIADTAEPRPVEPERRPPEPVVAAEPAPAAPELTDPAAVADVAQPGAQQAVPSTASNPSPAAPSPGLAAGASHVQSWPADTRLTFRLSGVFHGPLHGTAQVQWQRQNDRYQVRVEVDPNLLPGWVMTSQGEIMIDGLAPRIYEEVQLNRTRTVRLGEQTVTLNDGRSVPRPVGVQDTASQFIELSHRFAMGQVQLTVPGQVTVWLARPGGVDQWTYDILGPVALETDFGRIETFHLKPRPIANPRGNITPEIWFAPSLLYLPVRIRVNQGDAFVDLLVEKIEQR